jgi:hypothetical protein
MTWPPGAISARSVVSADHGEEFLAGMRTGNSSSTLTPASASVGKAAAPPPGDHVWQGAHP